MLNELFNIYMSLSLYWGFVIS